MSGDQVTYTQQAAPCADHGGCVVIVCAEDGTGRQVWESHADAAMHPECRANPGHPLLGPGGAPLDPSREMCGACRAILGGAR